LPRIRAARRIIRSSPSLAKGKIARRRDVREISDAEVVHADAYEVAAYVRVKAPVASGLKAWGLYARGPSLRRRERKRRTNRLDLASRG
jgi:hypothetical protein